MYNSILFTNLKIYLHIVYICDFFYLVIQKIPFFREKTQFFNIGLAYFSNAGELAKSSKFRKCHFSGLLHAATGPITQEESDDIPNSADSACQKPEDGNCEAGYPTRYWRHSRTEPKVIQKVKNKDKKQKISSRIKNAFFLSC